MKKFYRRSDGCGRDGKIYKSCIEIYKQKGEVCDLGDEIYKPSGDICKSSDEIYKPKGEARDFSDEIYGLIGTVYKQIRARSCGAKAAGGDV
ncbi:hypothetical protein [uncultured Campylobacter sp.]|uniref:hypothetical protein n=1 Tax=uncultured Campylobacter sp. TaxID=218934 RepID=UPI00261E489B|nr:hypothetical protein [uncultured Campylobacter sp.]